jgi:hypothetical protein
MRNQKGFTQIILILVIVVVAIGAAYYFGTLKNKSGLVSVVPTPTPIVKATQTPSPAEAKAQEGTANWKTYTNTKYGFSFKYPDGFQVKERASGYFVITTTSENSFNGSLQEGISIDARLLGSYANIDSARNTISNSLVVSENKKVSNWEVTQGVGKDGMLKGVEFRQAIIPYKTGVIEVETITNAKYLSIFDQILSTFQFTK